MDRNSQNSVGKSLLALALLLLMGMMGDRAMAQENAQRGATNAPQDVILDTDIGDDIDDAYALALLAALPNARLRGVTTCFGRTEDRARLAAKLLTVMGRGDVPVYAGRRGEAEDKPQFHWAQNARPRNFKTGEAVAFLKREIEHAPGKITIIGIGPLMNLSDLLTQHPEVKPKIKNIVLMGGSFHIGYNTPTPVAEWNIFKDPAAARVVVESGVPLIMAGLDATLMPLDEPKRKRVYAHGTPTTDALAALTSLWGSGTPTLFDPVAVAYALGHAFAETESVHVEVTDDGITRITPGTPNVTILVRPQKEAFLDWYINALAPQGPPTKAVR